jgi:hypothetical protein
MTRSKQVLTAILRGKSCAMTSFGQPLPRRLKHPSDRYNPTPNQSHVRPGRSGISDMRNIGACKTAIAAPTCARTETSGNLTCSREQGLLLYVFLMYQGAVVKPGLAISSDHQLTISNGTRHRIDGARDKKSATFARIMAADLASSRIP